MSAFRNSIDNIPVLSTHEHHLPFNQVENLTLDEIFAHSLVSPFTGVDCSDRGAFLHRYAAKSSFVWLEKALDHVFGIGHLTESNWDAVSARTAEAFGDPSFHERLLREVCGYTRAILDAYWDPGSDNGRPDLYSGSFRIDTFLYGCNREFRDPTGTNINAQVQYGECSDLDEYLALVDRVLGEVKQRGCCAIKSGLAHTRALDYRPRKKEDAARIFGRPASDVSTDDLLLFGDFIFNAICDLAAKHGLVFQIHVGLSVRLPGSNPIGLIPMIERHRETRFALIHGGFPWLEETAALAHNYANISVDLSWLPMVSTTAAERLLSLLIETGAADRITWGGDTWFVIDSYAGLLAMRHILVNVLGSRLTSGYLTEERAKQIAEQVLHDNAKRLYGI